MEEKKSCQTKLEISILQTQPCGTSELNLSLSSKMSKEIYYSDKYEDDKYEYRHVMLPKVWTFVMFSPNFISSNVRLWLSWFPRRTACPSKSGGTLGSSKALGNNRIFFRSYKISRQKQQQSVSMFEKYLKVGSLHAA